MSQDICERCGIRPAVVGNAEGGVCFDCIRAASPDPDPLLSIRKSRLEAFGRMAFRAGGDRMWNDNLSGENKEVLDEDTYIARAIKELTQ